MSYSAHHKILVIGCPGSGKSCFARKLRDIRHIPLYYLDMLFHRPDKTTVNREEFDEKLREILGREQWIIDGNYLCTLPLRLEAAEQVFVFDLPVEDCLRGAAERIGTKREDLPWVETDFDPDFRQYLLGFPRDQLPRIRSLLDEYKNGKDIVTFFSRREADEYLRRLQNREEGRTIRIRPIEDRDNGAVEGVIRACLREFGADHEGTAWADPNLGRFSQVYAPQGSAYWVAEDEQGNIVGGAGIGPLSDTVCELQKMYCVPGVRGTDTAQRLMDLCLGFARERYRFCYLETLENMRAAARFYEKNGFHRTEEPVAETDHFACDIHYIREL